MWLKKQTAEVQVEEDTGTHRVLSHHTCVPSFAHLQTQGSFILKMHYVSDFLSSSSALCRQICRLISTDTAARLMGLWLLSSASGQVGWVLVLRLRPVSVFNPNVRLARPRGDLRPWLLEQYLRTSVTSGQGEKHQRKPQHFVLHQQRISSWLPPSEEASALVKGGSVRLRGDSEADRH